MADLLQHAQSTFNKVKHNLHTTEGIKYVAPNTVLVGQITEAEQKNLAEICQFLPDEKLEVLWSHSGKPSFEKGKNVVVGITNLRVFKLENEERIFIFRSDIMRAEHEHTPTFFTWDKVRCVLKDYSRSLGVYHTKACDFLVKYINENKVKVDVAADMEEKAQIAALENSSAETLPAITTLAKLEEL